MDLGLRGKRALVMGGGRGIGRGIAAALAAEGASVAIVSRNREALEKAALEIGDKTGAPMMAVAADLADHGSIAKAYHRIAEALAASISWSITRAARRPPAPPASRPSN